MVDLCIPAGLLALPLDRQGNNQSREANDSVVAVTVRIGCDNCEGRSDGGPLQAWLRE